MLLFSPESQRHCALTHLPLEQLNWVRGSQVGKAEKELFIDVGYNHSTYTITPPLSKFNDNRIILLFALHICTYCALPLYITFQS